MKYVVSKEFLDRFDNMRHCKPGEPHVPPTKERAKHLLELGFIEAVEVSKKPDQVEDKKESKDVSNKKENGDGEKTESK